MTLGVVYPFLEVFWTILVFFAFVVWLWLLFSVFGDLFRRDDISGWTKVLWMIFIVVLPFLGVFAYVILEHAGMTRRTADRHRAAQQQFDSYIKSVAGDGGGSSGGGSGAASEIATAKRLLDDGAITEAEYEQLKRHALTH